MDEITVRPAEPATWPAVQQLLGQQTGGVSGCWCMFFRLTRSGFNAGWAAIAPRSEYSRLDRSPIAKPVDEQPVWSLVCLFVPPKHRGKGVARALVRAACEYAAEQGADVVEAYPVDDTLGKVTADEAYHGLVSLLSAEQFTEVARRLPKRPVMRRAVRE